MLLNVFEIIIPIILLGLICIPLIKAFFVKATKSIIKRRLYTHIGLFFSLLALVLVYFLVASPTLHAEETGAIDAMTGSLAQGLGFISAALSTGLSALGAGIAVGNAAPAAIGALSENEKNFGKSMIFIVLGEGVAIYGILISILIINKL